VRLAWPPRIALVGLMGSGKTTVGRHLARHLGYDFVDMDAELARRAGRSVARIFEQEGRRVPAARVRAVARAFAPPASWFPPGRRRHVAENRHLLRERFRALWLKVGVATAWRRLGSPTGRPMLLAAWLGATPLIRLRHLARLREPLYADVAAAVPAGRPPAAVAAAILKRLAAGVDAGPELPARPGATRAAGRRQASR
jgi:shikimate kinase